MEWGYDRVEEDHRFQQMDPCLGLFDIHSRASTHGVLLEMFNGRGSNRRELFVSTVVVVVFS